MTVMAVGRFVLVLLLGSVSLTSGEPGLISDCLMDIAGPRGTCIGLCVVEHLALTNISKCIFSEVEKFSSKFGEEDDLFGDRTDICRLVQNIVDCMADAIEEDCGTNLINDVRDFISAHIGCGNPTGPSLLTCVANPDLIKEIGSQGLSHKCIAKAIISPVVTDLMYRISSLRDNPVNEGFVKSVMKTLRDNRNDVCKLAKELTKCFIDDMADNGKDYCNEEHIKLLEGEVNGMLDMMGCPDDKYYDVMKCGLNGDLWVDQVLPFCNLKSAFGSLLFYLTPILEGTGQLNLTTVLKNLCWLHEPLDCIGNYIRASCGQNWTYNMYEGVVKPLQQYMDYKVKCERRNHPSVIPSCQCKRDGTMFSPCPDPPFPRCSGGGRALPLTGFYGLVAYLVLLIITWTRHL